MLIKNLQLINRFLTVSIFSSVIIFFNTNAVFSQTNIEPGETHEFFKTTYTSFMPSTVTVTYTGEGNSYFTLDGHVWITAVKISNDYLSGARFYYKCDENTPSGEYSGTFTIKFSKSSQSKTIESAVTFVVSGGDLVADFSATSTSGSAPLTVQFIDQSSGNITEYEWNFGDGQTSNESNPSHTFDNAGIYTVQLTVTGDGASNTKTRANYIQVKSDPVVDNIRMSQRTDGTLLVDVLYDLIDADGDKMNVTMLASNDDGQTWDLPCTTLSGDIGIEIDAGTDKQIVWDFFTDNPHVSGDRYKVKITADDSPFLQILQKELTLEPTGGSQASFEIITNTVWEASSDVDWLVIEPVSGIGNDTLIVSAESDNPSTNTRVAVVTVAAEGIQEQVNIIQAGGEPSLAVSTDSLRLDWVSDSKERFTISSNTDWDITVDVDWLSLSPTSGSNNAWVTVTATEDNPLAIERTAIVTLTAPGTSVQTVYVSQIRGFESGTMTDLDGNIYRTVKIGNQWWMAENLRTTKYRDGSDIDYVTDDTIWSRLSTGAYCYYDNDTTNVAMYGALYNWYAVNDRRNIAPSGWHVPTDDDWKKLEIYLGMSKSDADSYLKRGTIEGHKLKAISGWKYNGDGNNESGFTARPGGYHSGYDGVFYSMSSSAVFWCSTEGDDERGWSRSLGYDYDNVGRYYNTKDYGFSVRLVRNK